jgi:hypothetical protein
MRSGRSAPSGGTALAAATGARCRGTARCMFVGRPRGGRGLRARRRWRRSGGRRAVRRRRGAGRGRRGRVVGGALQSTRRRRRQRPVPSQKPSSGFCRSKSWRSGALTRSESVASRSSKESGSSERVVGTSWRRASWSGRPATTRSTRRGSPASEESSAKGTESSTSKERSSRTVAATDGGEGDAVDGEGGLEGLLADAGGAHHEAAGGPRRGQREPRGVERVDGAHRCAPRGRRRGARR